MKLKLLQAAISAALISAPVVSAVADVKIYGSVQAEYSIEDIQGEASEQGVDDNAFRSRIGFKSTEKLGNGLTAIALLEFQANPTDGGGLAENRQAFVGLKHEKWGFLALGTFKSPYRTAGGENIDPFFETNLQAAGAGGQSSAGRFGNSVLGNDGFTESAIYYKSPTWNSLTLDVVFSPDEKDSGLSDFEGDVQGGDDNDYAIAVNYRNGPIYAFAAYGENSNDDGQDEQAWKFGGSYSLAGHTLSGQYEIIQNSNQLDAGTNVNGVSNFSQINATEDGNVWFLGYQYKLGNNTFVAQYGQTDTEENANNNADYFAVGVIHNFSKRTSIFAGYSETSNDGDGNGENGQITSDREVFSIGLRKDF